MSQEIYATQEMPPAGRYRERKIKLPILYYHRVEENVPFAKGISPRIFATQMEYLWKRGYHSVSFDDLADHLLVGRPLPSRPFIISFDDGYIDHFTRAYPVMKRYGFTATIFIPSAFIGRKSEWEGCTGEDVVPLMSYENIQAMLADGFQFGAHTQSHKNLISLPAEEARDEVEQGKKELEELLQKPVGCFAYPFGNFNQEIIGIVKNAGFTTARTVHTGNTHRRDDLLTLRCVQLNGNTSRKFKYYLTGLYNLETNWHEWRKRSKL